MMYVILVFLVSLVGVFQTSPAGGVLDHWTKGSEDFIYLFDLESSGCDQSLLEEFSSFLFVTDSQCPFFIDDFFFVCH